MPEKSLTSSTDVLTKPGVGAPFKLTGEERRVLIVCILVSAAAKMAALGCAYSIDDFAFITNGDPYRFSLSTLVGNGRVGMALLLSGLNWIGLKQPQATATGVMLAIVLFSYMSVLISRLWRISGVLLPACITTCLITLHPYQVEFFTFRIIVLVVSVALFLGVLAAYYLIDTHARSWLPITLLVVACFIYQTAISYTVLTIATTYSLRVLLDRHKASGWLMLKQTCIQIGAVGFAVALYLGVNASLLSAMTVPAAGRFSLISASGLGDRLRDVMRLIERVFVQQEPILPFAVKILLVLLLIISGVSVLFRPRPAGSGRRVFVWRVAAAMATVAILIATCIGALLVVREWWPAPRTLAQFGIFWGFVFVIGAHFTSGWRRKVLIASALATCVCFAGLNSWVLTDQRRMNERDRAKVLRIVMRLESLPSFDAMRSLLVFGAHWDHPLPLETVYFDMNVSALYVKWATINAVNEFTGYRFSPATSSQAQAIAKNYCASAPVWPAAQSVAIMDDLGVVCLGHKE